MKYQLLTLSLFVALSFTTLAQAAKWNAANDPAIMGEFEYSLEKLPQKAELPVRPWSETYWASKQGSINIRWNQDNPVGFGYVSPSREQVAKMSLDELKRLSPSEKYDIFMGRYDYPLRNDVESIATPRARWWSGLCDGWSIAAIRYAEPQPVTLANPDGILVPFGSSDVKGLLAYHGVRHFKTATKQVGLRCFTATRILGSAACGDVNPGSLHVILGNKIGLQKQAFIVERDPGNQVWNQPAYGYDFKFVGSAESEAGVRGVHVRGTLFYTDELETSQWQPVTGTSAFVEGKLELEYILDIDSQGRIIGGRWLRGSDIPDFVWSPVETFQISSEMEGLNRIYKPVTGAPGTGATHEAIAPESI
jgi:hypothetical protein